MRRKQLQRKRRKLKLTWPFGIQAEMTLEVMGCSLPFIMESSFSTSFLFANFSFNNFCDSEFALVLIA